MIHLKVITPKKIVKEQDIESITVPSSEGELTLLPRHVHFFTRLVEGIVTIRSKDDEEFMAIGGGYLETDGKSLQILVSRAYGQDEIDEELTEKAMASAKQVLEENKDKEEITSAQSLLRRSIIDMKLLKKKRKV